MVTLDWTVRERDDVTLVELRVDNDSDVARRVRVANRLDGPAWPPRRTGAPESGWDEGGFEGRVDADGRLALGYASPAAPADPPAAVVVDEPCESADEPDALDPAASPITVLQALGDPRPPRSAVPTPSARRERSGGTDAPNVPPAVAEWLTDVERRVERCERVATAESVVDAARAVEAVGGLDDVAELRAAVEADRATLRAVEGRVARLAEHANGATDVPLAALRRLA